MDKIKKYLSDIGRKGGKAGKGKKKGGIWLTLTDEEKSERMRQVAKAKKLSE